MSQISVWSKIPAQNGTRGSPPIYWPEGQAPSTVNDCARQMMSSIRIQMQDAAWFDWGFTCTKIAGNKFSMLVYTSSATTSVADRWVVGRRLKLFDTATLYGAISEVSASGSDYNVTVTMDGTNSLSASFSSVALAIIDPNENIIPSGQTIYQNGEQIYAAANSGSDAYTVTLSPIPTSYVNGFVINFKADVANTGAATLNVNGLGAVAITKQNNEPLVTGDIEANQIVNVVYNSTGPTFQMQSQVAKPWISQIGTEIFGADAGASDAYAITLTPALASYVTGQMINFTANTTNTGAATLNVNGLGAKTIKKLYNQDLANGDIAAGQMLTVIYDGTNFQLQSLPATGGGGGAIVYLGSQTASASATLDFANLFSASYDQYLFTFTNILAATDGVDFYMLLGTGAGPTYANTSYNWNSFSSYANTGYLGVGAENTSQFILTNSNTYRVSNVYGINGHLQMSGTNAASTNMGWVAHLSLVESSTDTQQNLTSAGRRTAATYTAVRFLMSSGNITSGTIRMYGISNS